MLDEIGEKNGEKTAAAGHEGGFMPEKIIDKNYGSIPHLSTSKMSQQADKKISEGQEKILTEKTRDWKDLIIVTEKIDGSNVGIIKQNGKLIALGRSGYTALSSPYSQHKLFAEWLDEHQDMFEWMPEGWRVCGEWCILAHGTIYDITEESPFAAFDIIDQENNRVVFLDFYSLCRMHTIPMVPVLHIGQPVSIKNAVKLMGAGHYGKPDKPEGFVYRCEREGVVDFLAKWVRSDKDDGKYLSDEKEIWNIGVKMKQPG